MNCNRKTKNGAFLNMIDTRPLKFVDNTSILFIYKIFVFRIVSISHEHSLVTVSQVVKALCDAGRSG